jgi:hypothetical protein
MCWEHAQQSFGMISACVWDGVGMIWVCVRDDVGMILAPGCADKDNIPLGFTYLFV